MSIVKQVDSVRGELVAFIDATPRWRAGNRVGEEYSTGDTYTVELHRRPVNGHAFKHCGHEHREIDAAVRCATKLLRRTT